MPVHRLLVGTHASAVHLIEFDSTARSLVLKHSLQLAEQTSWIALSPSIPGLFYVNSWSTDRIFAVRVEEGGFVVLSETTFVGEGPTHFEVEEGGAALVAVNYRGGTLVRHPLLLSGLFSFPSPLPNHVHHFHYPLSTPPHSRQDSSHPHQIIPISQDGKTFLVTDLGTDRLIELRWEGAEDNGSWNELRQYSVEAQNGPRHGVKQGSLLYLVNEIAATVSVHPLPAPSTALNASSISPTHLPSIATFAVLPPNLRDAPRVGGFDRIPSTILLLDPRPDAPPNSPSTLLISNRNAPPELSPEGDTFLQYSVHPTEPTKLVDPIFHSGAGLHIRGLSAGPTAGAEKECFVLALGRDYGGLSMYERKKDGSLQLIVKNALGQEIEKPVVAVWLP